MAAPLRLTNSIRIAVNSAEKLCFLSNTKCESLCSIKRHHSKKIVGKQKAFAKNIDLDLDRNLNLDLDLDIDNLFGKTKPTVTVRHHGYELDGHGHGQLLSRPNQERYDKSSNPRSQTFAQHLYKRRQEALRSVVVRTQNPEKTVHILRGLGNLKFVNITSSDKAYVLAEFADVGSVKKVLRDASFFGMTNQFTMRSRCLFDVNQASGGKGNRRDVSNVHENEGHNHKYQIGESLDEELWALHRERTLTDTNMRVRFLMSICVEDILKWIIPDCQIIPYGSCLNGFGWRNSDLDLMLCLNPDSLFQTLETNRTSYQASPFRFLTEIFSSERQLAQRTLSMVASMVELMPRTSHVSKILNARVPIIRFKHLALNLQCDISFQAVDSLKMTELLYLMSIIDDRVQPLMTVIKEWAIKNDLTSSGEQHKPTTIGFVSLLIFFLQTRTPPVLPTLSQLQSLAGPKDKFIIDSVIYGFPRKPNKVPELGNTESLESLLRGFFLFFSEFDFKNKAISLIEGDSYKKLVDAFPLVVENPLCVGLNICRNVSQHNLEILQNSMANSVRVMDDLSSGTELESSRLALLLDSMRQFRESYDVELDAILSDLGKDENDSEHFGEVVDNSSVKVVETMADETDDCDQQPSPSFEDKDYSSVEHVVHEVVDKNVCAGEMDYDKGMKSSTDQTKEESRR